MRHQCLKLQGVNIREWCELCPRGMNAFIAKVIQILKNVNIVKTSKIYDLDCESLVFYFWTK